MPDDGTGAGPVARTSNPTKSLANLEANVATLASKLAKDFVGLEVLATGPAPVPSSGNKHFFLCSFSCKQVYSHRTRIFHIGCVISDIKNCSVVQNSNPSTVGPTAH